MSYLKNIDSDLVHRAKQKEKEAIVDIVRKEEKVAFTLAYIFFGIRKEYQEKAKEMTQNAFVKAFQNVSSLEDETRFVPWFFAILNRACIDFTRSKAYQQTRSNPTDNLNENDYRNDLKDCFVEDLPAFHPEEVSNPAAIQEGIKICLQHLPDHQRISLLMYYFEGCSIDAIAQALGQSTSVIKMILCRGRKNLEEVLAKLSSEDRRQDTHFAISALLWYVEQEVEKAEPSLDVQEIVSRSIVPRIPPQVQRHTEKPITSTNFFASTAFKIVLLCVVWLCVIGGGIVLATQVIFNDRQEQTYQNEVRSVPIEETYKEGVYEMKEDIPIYDSTSREDSSDRTAFREVDKKRFKLYEFEYEEDGSVWAEVNGYYYSPSGSGMASKYSGPKYVCVKDEDGEYLKYIGDEPSTDQYPGDFTKNDFVTACGSGYKEPDGLGGEIMDDDVSYNSSVFFCDFSSGYY